MLLLQYFLSFLNLFYSQSRALLFFYYYSLIAFSIKLINIEIFKYLYTNVQYL